MGSGCSLLQIFVVKWSDRCARMRPAPPAGRLPVFFPLLPGIFFRPIGGLLPRVWRLNASAHCILLWVCVRLPSGPFVTRRWQLSTAKCTIWAAFVFLPVSCASDFTDYLNGSSPVVPGTNGFDGLPETGCCFPRPGGWAANSSDDRRCLPLPAVRRCLPLPAACCLLLPVVACCPPLPSAACCLLLPAAACCCLLLPAVRRCLPLPAAFRCLLPSAVFRPPPFIAVSAVRYCPPPSASLRPLSPSPPPSPPLLRRKEKWPDTVSIGPFRLG